MKQKQQKQKLGPLQLKWVKALESERYKQGKGVLFDGERYCCLGVACEVLNIKFKNFGYEGESVDLPEIARRQFGFHGSEGRLILEKIGDFIFLTTANDHGVTFKKIAKFVRRYPRTVFEKTH